MYRLKFFLFFILLISIATKSFGEEMGGIFSDCSSSDSETSLLGPLIFGGCLAGGVVGAVTHVKEKEKAHEPLFEIQDLRAGPEPFVFEFYYESGNINYKPTLFCPNGTVVPGTGLGQWKPFVQINVVNNPAPEGIYRVTLEVISPFPEGPVYGETYISVYDPHKMVEMGSFSFAFPATAQVGDEYYFEFAYP